MEQGDLFGDIISVPSQTQEGVVYQVDVQNKTCTCPAFSKSKKPCKHMATVPGLGNTDITMPDIRMALSAMIKAVRLRYTNLAAYWFYYMWVRFPEERWRVCRRLVILAAEDNLSIPVQVSTASWLKYGARKEAPFRRALVELIRLTKTPNWWACEEGAGYMEAWNDAYKLSKKHPYQGVNYSVLMQRLKEKALAGDTLDVFTIHAELISREGHNKKNYNTDLLTIATEASNLPAMRMLRMMLGNLRALYGDDNYEGQVLWWLSGREFPNQIDPPVSISEIEGAESFINKHWAMEKKLPVPEWACDGVHTSGKDRRFGGILKSMVGCCRAFKHYGRLDPVDQWKPEFWG